MTKMSNSLSYCTKEKKPCVDWVEKYFNDCLCNRNDNLSFGFGLISLICWGIAEIPQISTNFRTKSCHGLSLVFLLTWIVGDVFNLVGCILEPATSYGVLRENYSYVKAPTVASQKNESYRYLQTQYYTALLYFASTFILVFQSIYYDHVCRWLKSRQIQKDHMAHEEKEPLVPKSGKEASNPIPTIPVKVSPRKDFFFTSARSLAGGSTPPIRSYTRPIRSGPPTIAIDSESTLENEVASSLPMESVTKPMPIPRIISTRLVGFGAFLSTTANMPRQSNALMQVAAGFTARKLLHESGTAGDSAYGQLLGWFMAVVYMGSRFPQIWLNIKRGSVEGLNPFMFVFAIIANLSYVASILMRTMEWDKVKPNMPWLSDAAICALLDCFILMQYSYYKYLREDSDKDDDYQEYTETK